MTEPAPVEIRPETPDDVPAIRAVVLRAFGRQVVADLVDALRASSAWVDGLSFVAVSGDQVVGHVMLTRSLLDAPDRLVDVLVLSPLSVVPERQRAGIGTALVHHAVAEADRRGEPLVFLEGHPGYYSRLGFERGRDHGFRRPSLRIPEPAFMVRRLSSYQPRMTGTLVYSEVFWRLDCVGLREPAGSEGGALDD